MDRGAWWAIARRVTKELDTTERLNNTNTTLTLVCFLWFSVWLWLARRDIRLKPWDRSVRRCTWLPSGPRLSRFQQLNSCNSDKMAWKRFSCTFTGTGTKYYKWCVFFNYSIWHTGGLCQSWHCQKKKKKKFGQYLNLSHFFPWSFRTLPALIRDVRSINHANVFCRQWRIARVHTEADISGARMLGIADERLPLSKPSLCLWPQCLRCPHRIFVFPLQVSISERVTYI